MLEQTNLQAGTQKWKSITKSSKHIPSLEVDILIPLAQSACFALPVGLLAGLTIGGLGYSRAMLPVGGLATITSFIYFANDAFSFYRSYVLESEIYDSGEGQAASATKQTLRVELHQHHGNSHQVIYDDLPCDTSTLALIRDANLSVRGLQEVGLSHEQAMTTIQALETSHYIFRRATNQPAEWSSKGKALLKSLPAPEGENV